jgi:uroporphyrinogen decarboxylase
MDSRERYLTAVELKTPDRVPIELRFAPELENRLRCDLGFEEKDLWEWIGQDAITIRPSYKNPASSIKYADPIVRVEGGFYYDIYQVPFKAIDNRFQKYLEPAGVPPLKGEISVKDIENFPWPSVSDWDYSGIEKSCEKNANKATWCRARSCFQTAMFIRGEEQFLIDMLTDPDIAKALLDRIFYFVFIDTEETLKAAKGKYTFVEYNDDVATQRSMFISPDLWRTILRPYMESFSGMVKKYGAKLRYHSCGSIYPIIPDLIEIGVDILNPIQALAVDMDPFVLKKEFGS